MNIDLHVHSKFSRRPSQWVLQKLGAPESFTEPLQLYHEAKRRGMTWVTITDHNTIGGAREIAHLPDTFISEEITTYFPDNGCKVHVLALNITASQHEEIQKVRGNIFDLAACLQGEAIVHVVAHPLYAVNGRLTPAHVEQMLLLFRNFELNGARDDGQNELLKIVLGRLQPGDIDELADRHGIQPGYDEPWKKNITGGSDDHSGLNIARTYTRINGASTVEEMLAALETGKAEPVRLPSSPKTMAHNLYAIAYQFYRSKFKLERYTRKDLLLRFLDRSLSMGDGQADRLMTRLVQFINTSRASRRPPQGADISETLMGLLRRETNHLLLSNPRLMEIARNGKGSPQERERQWFDFVSQVSANVIAAAADRLFSNLSGANIFNLFSTIGSVGGFYTLLAPYIIAYNQFTKDRDVNRLIRRRFGLAPASGAVDDVRVAHFTDTFYEVNGVAATLQQQVHQARRSNRDLTVITCDRDTRPPQRGIQHFTPIGVWELPEYPELKLYYPPFLDMLSYVYQGEFTHLHSATPGPIGLVALAIAHILNLPISGTYHTAFPQYARYLTGDNLIEELTWKYMLWYYDRMDEIYVSSQASADELTERGIAPAKIRKIPRGIDIQRFHPSKRNGVFQNRFTVAQGVKLIYVGRVSREKNLPLLADAYRALLETERDVHLVVVGEGPYLEEMRAALAGTPVTFTGYLDGEELAAVYASGDVFVFPSTTDTFGNVVLEAQASGIPVIVSDEGGPCESVLPDETGIVTVRNDTASLLAAMRRLVGDAGLRRRMGRAARVYTEDRSFEKAFQRQWEMYRNTTREAAA